jgi:D-alanyl-D-alanine carboxypeptidase
MMRRSSAVIASAVLVAACSVQAPTAGSANASSAATPSTTVSAPPASQSATLPPAATLTWKAFPAAPTRELLPSEVRALNRALTSAIGSADRLGAAATVMVGGRGTWSGLAGHGIDGTPVTAASVWQSGSIAKTAVAAQVLRLVERGRLRLEDPVAALLPAGSRLETNGASVADLLRMRSGLGVHQPAGTTFEYRNGDYVLLGHVIEAVEGRALGDVLGGDVLDVAGAERFRFPIGGTVDNASGPFDADSPSVARWGYELFGRHLIADASLARMVDFAGGEYGMGVFDFSVDFGELAVGHLGQVAPWSAALVVLPGRQAVIAVLMNSEDVLRTEGVAIDLAGRLGP